MATLKDLREGALLSQTELAKYVGVSLQTIYKWEHAQANPSPANRRKLVVALGVSPKELLEAIEETRKEYDKELGTVA